MFSAKYGVSLKLSFLKAQIFRPPEGWLMIANEILMKAEGQGINKKINGKNIILEVLSGPFYITHLKVL